MFASSNKCIATSNKKLLGAKGIATPIGLFSTPEAASGEYRGHPRNDQPSVEQRTRVRGFVRPSLLVCFVSFFWFASCFLTGFKTKAAKVHGTGCQRSCEAGMAFCNTRSSWNGSFEILVLCPCKKKAAPYLLDTRSWLGSGFVRPLFKTKENVNGCSDFVLKHLLAYRNFFLLFSTLYRHIFQIVQVPA